MYVGVSGTACVCDSDGRSRSGRSAASLLVVGSEAGRVRPETDGWATRRRPMGGAQGRRNPSQPPDLFFGDDR
jgi:hypothetical protein